MSTSIYTHIIKMGEIDKVYRLRMKKKYRIFVGVCVQLEHTNTREMGMEGAKGEK